CSLTLSFPLFPLSPFPLCSPFSLTLSFLPISAPLFHSASALFLPPPLSLSLLLSLPLSLSLSPSPPPSLSIYLSLSLPHSLSRSLPPSLALSPSLSVYSFEFYSRQ